jgi:predicted RND superfamily exporter protein
MSDNRQKGSKTTKRVFDVAKPSTTVAPANSKSIIISHGSITRDPTIIEDDQKTDEPAEEVTHQLAHQIKIMPINEDIKSESTISTAHSLEDELEPKSVILATAQPDTVAEPQANLEAPSSVPQDLPTAQEADSKISNDSVVNEQKENDYTKFAEEVKITPEDKQKTDQVEFDENLAKEATINNFIDQQTYFLPINVKQKKHDKKIILFGVIACVLLAVVWLDVVLDAGLINNNYNLPHTHFFTLKP